MQGPVEARRARALRLRRRRHARDRRRNRPGGPAGVRNARRRPRRSAAVRIGVDPDLSRAFLETAFGRGDRCTANFFHGRLVGYSFNAYVRARVNDQLDVLVPPGFRYGYKSWTHSEHRRANLSRMRGYVRRKTLPVRARAARTSATSRHTTMRRCCTAIGIRAARIADGIRGLDHALRPADSVHDTRARVGSASNWSATTTHVCGSTFGSSARCFSADRAFGRFYEVVEDDRSRRSRAKHRRSPRRGWSVSRARAWDGLRAGRRIVTTQLPQASDDRLRDHLRSARYRFDRAQLVRRR